MTLGSFPSVSASKMDHGADCIVDIVNGIVRCNPLLAQRSYVVNVSALIFKRNVTPFHKNVVGFAQDTITHNIHRYVQHQYMFEAPQWRGRKDARSKLQHRAQSCAYCRMRFGAVPSCVFSTCGRPYLSECARRRSLVVASYPRLPKVTSLSSLSSLEYLLYSGETLA
jgi:hypothetical protein